MSRTVPYHVPEYLARRETAKTHERIVQLAAVGVAVVCVLSASLLVSPIDKLRIEHQLTLDPETTRGLPPDMALMTKMGTFRALAIDFAFMRLEKLKQDDKYYELDKLSTLICKLAPRFPSVWSYCAWNQAYNISVTQYSPEGRWYWVKNGLELLRKEGIPYNEKSIGLYRELAWIFWHKIGDFLDDHHWHYKKELAVEMERVLGAPVVAIEDRDVIDSFAQIARAPTRLEDLLAEDAEVAEFVDELATVGLFPDDRLLEFVARNVRHRVQIAEIVKELEEDDIRTERQARVELLADPARLDARDRLLACLRNIALREEFNMDPQWMLKLMQDYGPLDWRTPFMHGLYWATKGDMVTRGQLNLDENDSMNVVRLIFFSLEQTIKRGKLVLEPDFDTPANSYLELVPDSRFIPYLHETYLRMGKEQFGDDPRFIPGTSGPNYLIGHFTFLGDWIRQLYTEGGSKNVKLAKEYYAYLREYNRDDDGSPKEQYLQPLEKFVMQDFYDDLTGFKTANMTVGAWIQRSLKYLSIGEVQAGRASLLRAKKGWEHYMKSKGIDPGQSHRRHLAPFKAMYADAVGQVMTSTHVAVIHKVRLWKTLDLIGRRMSYDRLLPYLTELAAAHQPPIVLEKAFPEPPGMEEYRRSRPKDFGPDESIDPGEKAW